jgi:hypothetical protein
MGRFGSREQMNAYNLFVGDDELMKILNEASMDTIHKYISYFKDYMITLDDMLAGCEPWLSEEELEEQLLYDPDYENMIYDLGDYEISEGVNYVYKSEIVRTRNRLIEKMAEYDRHLVNINVNLGVALALMISR